MTVHRGPARTNCGVDETPLPVTFAAGIGLRCVHRELACAVVVAAAVSAAGVDASEVVAAPVADGGGGGEDGMKNVISDGGDDSPPAKGPGEDKRMSLTEADDVRETCFDCDSCACRGRGDSGDEESDDSESDRIRDRRTMPGPEPDPGDTGGAMCGDTAPASRDQRGPAAKPAKPKGPVGGAHAEPGCLATSFPVRPFRFFGSLALAWQALAPGAPVRTGLEADGGCSAERVPDSESRTAGDPDSVINVWADRVAWPSRSACSFARA